MEIMSEKINELIIALSKAQGKFKNAEKDNLNPHLKSKYADLTSVWEACREILAENHLAVSQILSQNGTDTVLITLLAHSSGQWLRSELIISPTDKKAQSVGSAITYARRYSLSAILGITPGDNDPDRDDDGDRAQRSYQEIVKQEKPPVEIPIVKLAKEKVDELTKLSESITDGCKKSVKSILDSWKITTFSHLNDTQFKQIKTMMEYSIKSQEIHNENN